MTAQSRLLGDAVLAFFGAPVAHEDDPERAVLAELEMLEDIRQFQARFRREFGMAFDIRVGINTGEVVFGTLMAGGDETTAMGDAVNVAARMQQLARPNSVQISADTYGMVSTLFEVEPLGEIDVRGKRDAVTAYRVVRYRPPSRALGGVDANAVPLVGRDEEMVEVRQVVEEFRAGTGQALVIIGETGLGKTRLIDELHRLCISGEASDAHWSEARGISYDMRRPYGVAQQLVRRDVRVTDATPLANVETSVARRVHDVTGESDEALERVIQTLLSGVPESDGLPAAPEDFQREVFESVGRFYRELAGQTGLVLAIDDLHWSDAASAELLAHLLPLVQEARALLIFASRPEQQSAAWAVKERIGTRVPDRSRILQLQPLPDDDSAHLIDTLLKNVEVPDALRATILQKTGGNPLFVEEVVRALADRVDLDAGRLRGQDPFVIPDSLQALLTARIDNLDRAARQLLQFASVIGRTFSASLLQRISAEREQLGDVLATLERAGIIEETQRIPKHRYGFRHELMRDVVYRSILRRDRRRFHRQVAVTLEALTPNRHEDSAYQLAHHYREAGDLEKALPYSVVALNVPNGSTQSPKRSPTTRTPSTFRSNWTRLNPREGRCSSNALASSSFTASSSARRRTTMPRSI
jgi:hypothetical protein